MFTSEVTTGQNVARESIDETIFMKQDKTSAFDAKSVGILKIFCVDSFSSDSLMFLVLNYDLALC